MSKHKYIVSQQQVLASEIRDLTGKIEPFLAEHSKAGIIITMLAIAVLIQKPELDADKLQEIISDLSKRIALLLGTAPEEVN